MDSKPTKRQLPKLTDAKIANFKIPANGYDYHWDGHTTGLAVRVSYTGTKVFIFDFTTKARRRRRMVLDQWADGYRLSEARKVVAAYNDEIEKGGDPLEAAIAEQAKFNGRPTVADLAADYEKQHLIHKRESSRQGDSVMLRQYVLPKLGNIAVADVLPWHIERLVNEIGHTGGHPYRANRVRSLLSTLFNRAVRVHQMCASNPVLGTKKFIEHPRRRYLNAEELPALMEALDTLRNQRIADAIKLLLFTGARRGEVLTAEWGEFDLKRGVWSKPSHHTKQKEPHAIPLNSLALELVRAMHARRHGDEKYLFPGSNRDEPFKDIKKPWRQVVKRAGLTDFRLHDLRHSFASILINRNISLEVVGKLLGHSQAATTRRYAHLVDDTLREASEKLTLALPVPTAAGGSEGAEEHSASKQPARAKSENRENDTEQ